MSKKVVRSEDYGYGSGKITVSVCRQGHDVFVSAVAYDAFGDKVITCKEDVKNTTQQNLQSAVDVAKSKAENAYDFVAEVEEAAEEVLI